MEVKMANITLKIEDELLNQARRMAIRKNTSLNAVVRNMISDFVRSDTQSQEAIQGLNEFYLRCDAETGGRSWTREDLHER
jgi:predicted transcriptional regulator